MSLDITIALAPGVLTDDRALAFAEAIQEAWPGSASGWSRDPDDSYVSVIGQMQNPIIALMLTHMVLKNCTQPALTEDDMLSFKARFLRGEEDPLLDDSWVDLHSD